MVMGLRDLFRAIQLMELRLNFLYLPWPHGPIPCLLPPPVGDMSYAGASLRLS